MNIYQILRVRESADRDELQAKYLRMLDTYQMTLTFAESPEVAEIARIKLEQLVEAGKKCGLDSENFESSVTNTIQTDISSIKLALNSSGCDASKLRGSNILGKIDLLPKSAEKHYLKAMVNLRLDSSFQGCQNAVEEIQNAIRLDPTNEAYTGLLDAISEQLKEYEQRQRDRAIQEERERQKRERLSQEALDRARRRQFWNSFGPCASGVGAIALNIFVCWCICYCCESSC